MRIVGEGIFNLTGQDLSNEELSVLDKGLKYAPIQNLNKFNTYIRIRKYVRKITIKKALLSNPLTRDISTSSDKRMIQHSSLRNKSLFNPHVHDNQHIKVFKNLVLKDQDQLKIKKVKDPIHKRHTIIDR